jgi:hypothetical protein
MKLPAKTGNYIREDLSILRLKITQILLCVFFATITSWMEHVFGKGV